MGKQIHKYMVQCKEPVAVEWEYLEEGYCGDYDEDDPEDEPLLRFTVSQRESGKNGPFRQVDDASYCTHVSAFTPQKILRQYLILILDEVYDEVVAGNSIKRICERISWIGSGHPERDLSLQGERFAKRHKKRKVCD